jgi:hypothetical protein
MVVAGQFIALQNSWATVSLDVWRVSRTTFFNARWSLSIIKRSLPGSTFPLYNHITNANLGNLRMVAMSLTDFLLMWPSNN